MEIVSVQFCKIFGGYGWNVLYSVVYYYKLAQQFITNEHVISLFNHNDIHSPKSMLTTVNIIQGGKASGFKNVQEATASMNPNRLYQVRGTNELNTRANEVSLQSDQYDSRKLKKGNC